MAAVAAVAAVAMALPFWGWNMVELFAPALACAAFVWGALRVARGLGWMLLPASFLAWLGQVLLVGYVLSGLNQLASGSSWLVGSLICALSIEIGAHLASPRLASPSSKWAFKPPEWLGSEAILLGAVFVVVALLQLAIIIAAAPHNTDSMTYHMARVGYYLQHGNIGAFESNFWAQLMHAKNSALAMTFLTFVAQGWTNAAQFLQYGSWLVLVVCLAGISIRLGIGHRVAIVAALAGALVVEVVLQATTTQDDLFITALGACFFYFGLGAFRRASIRDGVFAGLAAGIAFGTKISAIPLLFSIGLVLLLVTRPVSRKMEYKRWLSRGLALAFIWGMAGLIFGLPAGYLENMRIYGSPLGDPAIISGKSLPGEGAESRASLVVTNLARFGLDFIDPSGLPPTKAVAAVVDDIRATYVASLEALGVDFYSAPTLAPPYNAERVTFAAHEDFSYWGGWALLWFLPLGILGFFRSGSRRLAWALLLGGVAFTGFQAGAGIYDPWRGRYFIQLLVFATPLAALGWDCIREHRWARAGFLMVALVCCAISVNSVLDRRNSPWWKTLGMTWVEQVTRNTGPFREVLVRYEEIVPEDASVIVMLKGAYSEFPLFGQRLTRKLYPAPSKARLDELIEQGVGDYLVFNDVIEPESGDCPLGAGVYMRALKENNLARCEVGLSPHLSDILQIESALRRYHQDHAAYPTSVGWDGFMSRWGKPDGDWIDALTPGYIPTLPVARRLSANDWAMYLYRSDGVDYKLIVVAAEDATQVIGRDPRRKDPAAQGNTVYGVWSAGAQQWRLPEQGQ